MDLRGKVRVERDRAGRRKGEILRKPKGSGNTTATIARTRKVAKEVRVSLNHVIVVSA